MAIWCGLCVSVCTWHGGYRQSRAWCWETPTVLRKHLQLAIDFTSAVLYLPCGHDSSRPNLVFVSYGLAFEPPCQFTSEKVRKDPSTCEHCHSHREAVLGRVGLGEQQSGMCCSSLTKISCTMCGSQFPQQILKDYLPLSVPLI